VPPSRFVQRLFTVIPALVALAVLAVTLFGQDGLLRRHLLRRQLLRLQAEAGELERDNQLLRREVLRLQQSRTAIEREAAESLLLAAEDTVIYRFHDEAGAETE
jgi:cell division protein FtsB